MYPTFKGRKRLDKIPVWKEKVIEKFTGAFYNTAILVKFKSMFSGGGNLFILREPGSEHGEVFETKEQAYDSWFKTWKKAMTATPVVVTVEGEVSA